MAPGHGEVVHPAHPDRFALRRRVGQVDDEDRDVVGPHRDPAAVLVA
jgi:hypothetical protein